MKIDDSKLIRFINNDLPKFEKKELDSLIKNDPKLEFKLQGLKNFQSILKKESKKNKKTKMPKNLYKKINIVNNKESKIINFYKIAASFIFFASIGWLFVTPNTSLLSQNTSNYLSLLIILLLVFIIFLILKKK